MSNGRSKAKFRFYFIFKGVPINCAKCLVLSAWYLMPRAHFEILPMRMGFNLLQMVTILHKGNYFEHLPLFNAAEIWSNIANLTYAVIYNTKQRLMKWYVMIRFIETGAKEKDNLHKAQCIRAFVKHHGIFDNNLLSHLFDKSETS